MASSSGLVVKASEAALRKDIESGFFAGLDRSIRIGFCWKIN
jgi:hypothetical protein